MEFEVVENPDRKRFEADLGDKVAYLEYIRVPTAVYLTHTEVPPGFEGQGVGSSLVKQVLKILKAEEAKIAPMCPFVAAYIKRHPEWKELLAPHYNV